MNEEEAGRYLEWINKEIIVPQKNESPWSLHIRGISEDRMLVKNQGIIDSANELLLDRLENGDGSLRVSDIVNMKTEAFKQNQSLQGVDDVVDSTKLIPSVINIQIINN